MVEKLEFEFTDGLLTKDNYNISLKGIFELEEGTDQNEILPQLQSECNRYLSRMPLLEALDLVDADTTAGLLKELQENDNLKNIVSMRIQTIDAAEKQEASIVDYELDPVLETQTKSKGLFGKFKSIFKK